MQDLIRSVTSASKVLALSLTPSRPWQAHSPPPMWHPGFHPKPGGPPGTSGHGEEGGWHIGSIYLLHSARLGWAGAALWDLVSS